MFTASVEQDADDVDEGHGASDAGAIIAASGLRRPLAGGGPPLIERSFAGGQGPVTMAFVRAIGAFARGGDGLTPPPHPITGLLAALLRPDASTATATGASLGGMGLLGNADDSSASAAAAAAAAAAASDAHSESLPRVAVRLVIAQSAKQAAAAAAAAALNTSAGAGAAGESFGRHGYGHGYGPSRGGVSASQQAAADAAAAAAEAAASDPSRQQQTQEKLMGPWDAVTMALRSLTGQFDVPAEPDGRAVANLPLPKSGEEVAEWWSSDDDAYLERGVDADAALPKASTAGSNSERASSWSADVDPSSRRLAIERRLLVAGVRFLADLASTRVAVSLLQVDVDGSSGFASGGRASSAKDEQVRHFVAAMERSWFPRGPPTSQQDADASDADSSAETPPPTDARTAAAAPASGGFARMTSAEPLLWPTVFYLMRTGSWLTAARTFQEYAHEQERLADARRGGRFGRGDALPAGLTGSAAVAGSARQLASACLAVGHASTYALSMPSPDDVSAVAAARRMCHAAEADASAPAGRRRNSHCPFRLAVLGLLGAVRPTWEWGPEDEDDEYDETAQAHIGYQLGAGGAGAGAGAGAGGYATDVYGSGGAGETARSGSDVDPFARGSDELWRLLTVSATKALAAAVSRDPSVVVECDLRMLTAANIHTFQVWEDDFEDDDDNDDVDGNVGGMSSSTGETIDDDAYFFATTLLLLQRYEWAVSVLALHGKRLNAVSHAEDAVHIAMVLYNAGLIRTADPALMLRADTAVTGGATSASGPSASSGGAADGGARYAAGALLVRRSKCGAETARPHGSTGGVGSFHMALQEDASCRGDVDTSDSLCIRRLVAAYLAQRLCIPLTSPSGAGRSTAGSAGKDPRWQGSAADHPDLAELARCGAALPCMLVHARDAPSRRSLLTAMLSAAQVSADALAGDVVRGSQGGDGSDAASLVQSSISVLSGWGRSLTSAGSDAGGVAGSSARRLAGSFLPVSPPYLVESGVLHGQAWRELCSCLRDAAHDCTSRGFVDRAVDLHARGHSVTSAAELLMSSLASLLRPNQPHRESLRGRAALLVNTVALPPDSATSAAAAALRTSMTRERDSYGATFGQSRASLSLLLRIMDVVDAVGREQYERAVELAFHAPPGDDPILPSLSRATSSGLDSTEEWRSFAEAHPLVRPCFSALLVNVAWALHASSAASSSGGRSGQVQDRAKALRVLASKEGLALPPADAARVAAML